MNQPLCLINKTLIQFDLSNSSKSVQERDRECLNKLSARCSLRTAACAQFALRSVRTPVMQPVIGCVCVILNFMPQAVARKKQRATLMIFSCTPTSTSNRVHVYIFTSYSNQI